MSRRETQGESEVAVGPLCMYTRVVRNTSSTVTTPSTRHGPISGYEGGLYYAEYVVAVVLDSTVNCQKMVGGVAGENKNSGGWWI